jgi:uncharacterized protein (UPF0305 family)
MDKSMDRAAQLVRMATQTFSLLKRDAAQIRTATMEIRRYTPEPKRFVTEKTTTAMDKLMKALIKTMTVIQSAKETATITPQGLTPERMKSVRDMTYQILLTITVMGK